jgi:WD40 repeat protein
MKSNSLAAVVVLGAGLLLSSCLSKVTQVEVESAIPATDMPTSESLPTAEVVVATQTELPPPMPTLAPTQAPALSPDLAELNYRTVPQLEKLLTISQHDVIALEFSPDDRALMMRLPADEESHTDIFWDLDTGQESFRLMGGQQIYFNPSGATIAALDQKNLAVYDLTSGELKFEYNSHNPIIGLSPDGKKIIEVVKVDESLPGTSLRVVDLTTEEELYAIYVGGLVVENGVQFDRDGDLMALTYTIPPATNISTIWRTESGRMLKTLYGYSEIDLHPFGSEIAASSAKQRFISLISTVTWEQRIYLGPADDGPGYRDIAYAGEGRLLYALSGQDEPELSIWYPPSGEILEFDPGIVPLAVTISPDRKLLAISDAEGNVTIWGVPE